MLSHVKQVRLEAAKRFLNAIKEADEQNDYSRQVALQRQASKIIPEILGESTEEWGLSSEVARQLATLVLCLLEAREAV